MVGRRRRRRRAVPHVALIIETSLAYGRGLLRGVAQFVRENGPWAVYLEQRSLYDPPPPWLKDWNGDGIISRASAEEIAQLVVDTELPTVDLNEEVMGLGLPLIYNDHHHIGRLAAEHLLDRGFRHFGFIGHELLEWSNRRRAGFAETVARKGYTCHDYHYPGSDGKRNGRGPAWEEEMDDVAGWLTRLPKPAGVMACNDYRAVQLLDACQRAGVAVPEQVAVVGVDNEDVACELSNPPLTSVVPDAERIGYQAARLLDAMMRGEAIEQRESLVPPKGIVTRQSTEVTAIDDADVAAALHFIRRHSCAGIGVEDVMDEVNVSRSVLQRRFRHLLGRSIHDVITGSRIDRVKELLAESDLAVPDIAERTGFKHSEYLSTVFKQKTGETITQYRKRMTSADG